MSNFKNTKFDEITIEPGPRGQFDVYGHGVWPRSSVLAGRPKRAFLDRFKTLEEAQSAFPDAEDLGGSSKVDGYNSGDLMSSEPESWFDPSAAGEAWGENDY